MRRARRALAHAPATRPSAEVVDTRRCAPCPLSSAELDGAQRPSPKAKVQSDVSRVKQRLSWRVHAITGNEAMLSPPLPSLEAKALAREAAIRPTVRHQGRTGGLPEILAGKQHAPAAMVQQQRSMFSISGSRTPMYDRSTIAESTLASSRCHSRRLTLDAAAPLTPDRSSSLVRLGLRLVEWGEAPLFEVVDNTRRSDEPEDSDIVDVTLLPLSEPRYGLNFTVATKPPSALAKARQQKKSATSEQQKLQRVLRNVVPEPLAPRDVGRVSWVVQHHLRMCEPLTSEQAAAVKALDKARARLARISAHELHSLRKLVVAWLPRNAPLVNEPGVRQIISAVCSLLQLEPSPVLVNPDFEVSATTRPAIPAEMEGIHVGDYFLAGFAALLGGDPQTLINTLTNLAFDTPLPTHAISAAVAHAEDELFLALIATIDPTHRVSYGGSGPICRMGQWAQAFLHCYRVFNTGDAQHKPEPQLELQADFEPEPESEPDDALCEVCFEPATHRISTTCDHRYCADCISGSLEAILAASSFPACCPACRVEHVETPVVDSTKAAGKKGVIDENALAFFCNDGVISHHLYYRCLQHTLRAAKKPHQSFFLCPGKGCNAALCTQRIKPLAVPLEKLQKGKKGFHSVPQWKAQCPRCKIVMCNDCHLPARRRFEPHDGKAPIAVGDIVRALDCQACHPRFEVQPLDLAADDAETNADIIIGLRHTDQGDFEVVPGEFSAHWKSLRAQHTQAVGAGGETEPQAGSWQGLQRSRSHLEGCGTDDTATQLESVGLAGYEAVGGAWWRVDALIGLKLALPEPHETGSNDWRDATIVRTTCNGHIVRWSDVETSSTEPTHGRSRHRLFGVTLQGAGKLRVPAGDHEWEHDCPLKRKIDAKIDAKTEQLMETNPSFKRCPNCRKWLQRSEGCDMMLCGNTAHGSLRAAVENGGCGFQFNWRTGKECRGARYNLKLNAV